jgi:hypothetical protein
MSGLRLEQTSFVLPSQFNFFHRAPREAVGNRSVSIARSQRVNPVACQEGRAASVLPGPVRANAGALTGIFRLAILIRQPQATALRQRMCFLTK